LIHSFTRAFIDLFLECFLPNTSDSLLSVNEVVIVGSSTQLWTSSWNSGLTSCCLRSVSRYDFSFLTYWFY